MGQTAENFREVGNWVENNGEIIQVKPYHFEVFMNPESQPANAIPLTEEILLKCGTSLGLGWYDFKPFEYNFTSGELWVFGSDVAITHIKHLHELQNLYYSLCDEELNIEL